MKSGKDPRHVARMLAVMDLYENYFAVDSVHTDINKEELELGNFAKQIRDNVVAGVKENLAAIDEIVNANSEPIKITDLDLTLQQIIRVAVYEGFFAKSIPPKVAVDEAIELTRDFGHELAVKKISGVLGKVFEVKKPEFKEEEKMTDEAKSE